MASKTSVGGYLCSSCGWAGRNWFGRCPGCGEWSSATAAAEQDGGLTLSPLLLPEGDEGRLSTGLVELDRVLGGGFVAGEVVLLAGEPGIGKSTLVLQLLDGLNQGGARTLLVTGEESVGQVALRGARLGVDRGSFHVAADSRVEHIVEHCRTQRPDVLVVDSVQTLESSEAEQAAGSQTQVRECASALARCAKATGAVVLLVGHVTKEGSVAGPKTLEHLVDAVLALEGERSGGLRLLRAVKNRFGSCEETGVFVMGERGLEGVADPSSMLLADRRRGVSGSVVFPGLEGSRTLLAELQALVTASNMAQPRRVPIGLDARRLALLIGVLERHGGVTLGSSDVFVAAAGGIVVREPAADLALCLALFSAAEGVALDPDLVAVGEVGLGGEIRRVPGAERRLAEAARLGFRTAIVARGVDRVPPGLHAVTARDLPTALRVAHDMSVRADAEDHEPLAC